jgi:hypothetical protein
MYFYFINIFNLFNTAHELLYRPLSPPISPSSAVRPSGEITFREKRFFEQARFRGRVIEQGSFKPAFSSCFKATYSNLNSAPNRIFSKNRKKTSSGAVATTGADSIWHGGTFPGHHVAIR